MTKYKVTLTPDERQQLQKLITAGKASAKKLAHARILLKADAAKDGPAWSDNLILLHGSLPKDGPIRADSQANRKSSVADY
jgi:hypothetical protein